MSEFDERRHATGAPADLDSVLESAARLQRLVPDSVLVGGTAAALHAHHRVSHDHDHVLGDLADRFDVVLDALEAEPDWVTNRVTPGKIVLGELGGIEAGVRQLIRTTPLETESVVLPSGSRLVVPTVAETLRVKAFLIVRRNQVRDYLDTAALADRFGIAASANVLADIDTYYRDDTRNDRAVTSQLVRQLGAVRPKDSRTVERLAAFTGLASRWKEWSTVTDTCESLAAAMIERGVR